MTSHPSPSQPARAGNRWQTLFAVDFDRRACETYRANLPGVDVRCASVADVLADIPGVDVILGGPPCQPHSFAGKRGASSDKRDGGPDFAAAIARVRPRMFLMENVAGLMTSEGGIYAQRLLASLESAGYVVDIRVLDAVSFGVPQFRNRCWWWGVRRDLYAAGIRHRWPVPTHAWPAPEASMFGHTLATGVTVRQAIGLDGAIFRHRGAGWGERPPFTADEPSMTVLGAGDRFGNTLPVVQWQWSDEYLAKHPPVEPDAPSPAVTGQWHKGMPNGALNVGGAWKRKGELWVRRLTPLECLRLQSGPDDFVWPGDITKTAMYRVIGNGWACEMARVMSGALAAADPDSRTVADLFCGGGLGAVGWHGRSWRYEPSQKAVADVA